MINSVNGQDHYQTDLIKDKEVKSIEFYNYVIVNNEPQNDSTLSVKVNFNKEGYPVNTYIYDSTGIRSHYEKLYRNDSLLIRMNTYQKERDSLISIADFEYDDKNNKVSETHYYGRKKDVEILYKYDRQNRLKKMVLSKNGKTLYKTCYKYKAGKQALISKVKSNKSGNSRHYYDELKRKKSVYEFKRIGRGRMLYENEYEGKSDKLIQKRSKYYRSASIIGEGGIMDVKEGDEIRLEFSYSENGLIDFVVQYHNNKLDAVKKYKYLR